MMFHYKLDVEPEVVKTPLRYAPALQRRLRTALRRLSAALAVKKSKRAQQAKG
jgi:hypothetical protein